jgi:hypothetical protein
MIIPFYYRVLLSVCLGFGFVGVFWRGRWGSAEDGTQDHLQTRQAYRLKF